MTTKTFTLEAADNTGEWRLWDKSNEWLLGIIQETPIGPYFVPYQGPEMICWTAGHLEAVAAILRDFDGITQADAASNN